MLGKAVFSPPGWPFVSGELELADAAEFTSIIVCVGRRAAFGFAIPRSLNCASRSLRGTEWPELTSSFPAPTTSFPGKSYEHASRAGDFIFISGQIAQDENEQWVGARDARKQAQQIYRNIGRILAHMGASPQNVVKIHRLLTDRKDREVTCSPPVIHLNGESAPHLPLGR